MKRATEHKRQSTILSHKKNNDSTANTIRLNENVKAITKTTVIGDCLDCLSIPMMFGDKGVYAHDAKSFGDFIALDNDDACIEQTQMFVFWHMMFAILSQSDLGTPDLNEETAGTLNRALWSHNNPSVDESAGGCGRENDEENANKNNNNNKTKKPPVNPTKLHDTLLNTRSSYVSKESSDGSALFSPKIAGMLLGFYPKSGVYDYAPSSEETMEKFSIYLEPLRKIVDDRPSDVCAGFLLHVFRKDPNFSFLEALSNYFFKAKEFLESSNVASANNRKFKTKNYKNLRDKHFHLVNYIKDLSGFNPLLLKVDLSEWYKMTSGFLKFVNAIYEMEERDHVNADDDDDGNEDGSDSSSSNMEEESEEEKSMEESWEDEEEEKDEEGSVVYVADEEIRKNDGNAPNISPTAVFHPSNAPHVVRYYGACFEVKKRMRTDGGGNYKFEFSKMQKGCQYRHPLDCFYNVPLKYFNRKDMHLSYFPWLHTENVMQFCFMPNKPLYVVLKKQPSEKHSEYMRSLQSRGSVMGTKSLMDDRSEANKRRKTRSSSSRPYLYESEDLVLSAPSAFAVINHVVLVGERSAAVYNKFLTEHKYASSAKDYFRTASSEDGEKALQFCKDLANIRSNVIFEDLKRVLNAPTPILTNGVCNIMDYFRENVEGLKDFSCKTAIPINLDSDVCWLDSYYQWLYAVIKVDYNTFYDIPHMMIIMHSMQDTYRQEFNLHLGAMFTGFHGAGKSRKLEMAEAMHIPNTVNWIQSFSPKSLNTEEDASDMVNFMDEAGGAFSGSSNEKKNAHMDESSGGLTTGTVKQLMSQQKVQHQYMDFSTPIFLDNGAEVTGRVTRNLITPRINTYFICANRCYKNMNPALMDRMITLEISKKCSNLTSDSWLFPKNRSPFTKICLDLLSDRSDRTKTYLKKIYPHEEEEEEKEEGEPEDNGEDKGEEGEEKEISKEEAIRRFQKKRRNKSPQEDTESSVSLCRNQNLKLVFCVDQSLHMLVEKLIYCNGLPKPFMRGAYLILSRIFDFISDNGVPFDNRDFVKCMLMARVLTVKDAIHQVFKVYGCDRSEITYDNLKHVGPYLACSFNHIVHAFTLLSCQIVNPFKTPILNTIVNQIGLDTVLLHAIKDLTTDSKKYNKSVYTSRYWEKRQASQDTNETRSEKEEEEEEEDEEVLSVGAGPMSRKTSASSSGVPPHDEDSGVSEYRRNLKDIWSAPIHHLHRLFLMDYVNNDNASCIKWYTYSEPGNFHTVKIDLNYVIIKAKGQCELAKQIGAALVKGGQKISEESILENLKEFVQTTITVEDPMPVCFADQLIDWKKLKDVCPSNATPKPLNVKILEEIDDEQKQSNIGSNSRCKTYKMCLHALNETVNGELMLNAIKSLRYKGLRPRTLVTGMENREGTELITLPIDSKDVKDRYFLCASQKFIDDKNFARLYINPMFFPSGNKTGTDRQRKEYDQLTQSVSRASLDDIKKMMDEEMVSTVTSIDEDIDDWTWKQHFIKNGIPFRIDSDTKEMKWTYYDEKGELELRDLPTPINQGARIRNAVNLDERLRETLKENSKYL